MLALAAALLLPAVAQGETIPMIDWHAAVLDGDRALVGIGDRLWAVDLSGRELIWHTDLPTYRHTSPLLHDDTILLVMDSGDVVMLDARNGRGRGQFPLPQACADSSSKPFDIAWYGLAWSAREAAMLLTGGDRLCAVRVPEGELAWTRDMWAGGVAVAGDVGYVLDEDEAGQPRLSRLDLARGVVETSRAFGAAGEKVWMAPRPALLGDTIFVSVGGRLRAFDPATLEMRWETGRGPGGYLGPVVAGDAVVAVYPGAGSYGNWSPGAVSAFDVGTGERLWRRRVEGNRVSFAARAGDQRVIVALRGNERDFGAGRHLLCLDATSGDERWDTWLGDAYLFGAPLLHDGTLWLKLGDPGAWTSRPTGTPCPQEILRGYKLRPMDATTGELGDVIELPSRGSALEAVGSIPFGTVMMVTVIAGLLAFGLAVWFLVPGRSRARG